MSSRQRHSAQSAAEPRTLIVGDSIIRNISSRTTTTAALLKQPSLMWTRNFGTLWWSTRLQIESSSMWGRMIFGKGSQNCLSKISVNSLKHFKDLKFSRSSVDHSQQGELTCFHGCLGWIHGYKEPAVQKESTSSTTSIFSGATDNCLNWMASTQTNLVKSAKGQFLFLPPSSFSGVCQSTHTLTWQNMSDHRTSYQLPSHHVVEESHKDTDNATQPKQALLMDIPAEPCHRAHHMQTVTYSNSSKTPAPKDDLLENSLGSQDNTHSHRKHQS